jgi:hypothetical protein
MKNVLSTLFILMLIWTVRFGWNYISSEPYIEPTASEWAAEEDSWVQESLSEGSSAPARGWLDHPDHTTFEGHPGTMNELITKLHAAGAERVWMIDIAEWQGKELSDTVAVELPTSGVQRAMVFQAAADFADGEPYDDVGQRFLTMSFD